MQDRGARRADLMYSTREAKWLFGQEVVDIVSIELMCSLADLHHKQADHSTNEPEGARWLTQGYRRIDEVFGRYLQLADVG